MTLVCTSQQRYKALRTHLHHVQPAPARLEHRRAIFYEDMPSPSHEPVIEEFHPAPSYKPEEFNHYRDESSDPVMFANFLPVKLYCSLEMRLRLVYLHVGSAII